MDLLLAFIVAMIVTMSLIPPLIRAAASLHILDVPGDRKMHSGSIPCVGGLAMAVGAFLPLLLWLPMDRVLAAYLLSGILLIGFGVWDDRVSLSASWKLVGQLISVLIIVLFGHVTIDSITLTERIAIPQFVAIPLSVVFLLGVTNAINLSDGLDGLAGGTTLLACCALAALGFTLQIPFVVTIALVIVGSILGFLRFNTYPARIFMGDGGSQFLGFSAGMLSIVLTQEKGVPLSASLPILLLGLPIIDTLTVMMLRIFRGQSPFKADRNHIHHRLLRFGFDDHEAVMIIYILQACLFVAAWALRFESDVLILCFFTIFAAATVSCLTILKRLKWQVRSHGKASGPSGLSRFRAWLAADDRLPRWSIWAAAAGLVAYSICVIVYARPFDEDIGWLAMALTVILTPACLVRNPTSRLEWVAQGALYVAIAAAVYLDHRSEDQFPIFHAVKLIVFPSVIVAVAIRMRLSKKRRFQVTTLDVLLIILAVTLPNLPGMPNDRGALGFGIAKLVVLFYAVEILHTDSAAIRRATWVCVLAFCAAIAAETLLRS